MLTEAFIADVAKRYRKGELDGSSYVTVNQATGEYHGVRFGNDSEEGGGDYMILGDSLSVPGVYAEINDGAYGEYIGVRIYKEADF